MFGGEYLKFSHMLLGDHIRYDEMNWTCSMNWRTQQKSIAFYLKSLKGNKRFEYLRDRSKDNIRSSETN